MAYQSEMTKRAPGRSDFEVAERKVSKLGKCERLSRAMALSRERGGREWLSQSVWWKVIFGWDVAAWIWARELVME